VVIDHRVDRQNPRWRWLTEDVRLHIDQHEPVEVLEFLGGESEHVDPEGVDECAVLGSSHFTEGDERSGRALAT
jgi:hypothetical protein